MSRLEFWLSRGSLFMVAAMIILASSGCVGLTAQILYMIKGNKIEAECPIELDGKRVAVVCVTKSAYGNGPEGTALARMVAAQLRREVDDIEVVSHQKVADWIDNNDWDYVDYRAIGRGVEAELLIAIDLSSLAYYDGQTLYKGRADYGITLYDMKKGGKVVWSKKVPDYSWPAHGGRPVTDMVEAKFKQEFLGMLSRDISRCFYDYDKVEALANDAQLLY